MPQIDIPDLQSILESLDLVNQNDGRQLFEIFNTISLLLYTNKIKFHEYKNLFEKLMFESIEGNFAKKCIFTI